MRAVTIVISPPDEYPVEQLFADDSGVQRERIYNLTLLEDGTLVLLGRLRGDLMYARDVLAETPDVLGFSISGQDERGALVFVHARPPPVVRQLLELPSEQGVFFDFPIEATDDGQFEVTMVGETNSQLTEALEKIPPDLEVTVERIGPYLENLRSMRKLLTERQREILDVALDCGYYEVPRRATHQDIAERLDVSPPTVSEHLQKIETRVFGALES